MRIVANHRKKGCHGYRSFISTTIALHQYHLGYLPKDWFSFKFKVVIDCSSIFGLQWTIIIDKVIAVNMLKASENFHFVTFYGFSRALKR